LPSCAQPSSWAFGGGTRGGCEEAEKHEEDEAMVAAEEQRTSKQ
jgi:hypothetical protein